MLKLLERYIPSQQTATLHDLLKVFSGGRKKKNFDLSQKTSTRHSVVPQPAHISLAESKAAMEASRNENRALFE